MITPEEFVKLDGRADRELAQEKANRAPGSPLGDAAEGLLTVRLLEAIRCFNRTSTWLAGGMIFLGLVQVALLVYQLFRTTP